MTYSMCPTWWMPRGLLSFADTVTDIHVSMSAPTVDPVCVELTIFDIPIAHSGRKLAPNGLFRDAGDFCS